MSENPLNHYPRLLVIRGKAAFGVGTVIMHPLPVDAPAWYLRELASDLAASGDTGSYFLSVHLAFSPDRGLRFNGKGAATIARPPHPVFARAVSWGDMTPGG